MLSDAQEDPRRLLAWAVTIPPSIRCMFRPVCCGARELVLLPSLTVHAAERMCSYLWRIIWLRPKEHRTSFSGSLSFKGIVRPELKFATHRSVEDVTEYIKMSPYCLCGVIQVPGRRGRFDWKRQADTVFLTKISVALCPSVKRLHGLNVTRASIKIEVNKIYILRELSL